MARSWVAFACLLGLVPGVAAAHGAVHDQIATVTAEISRRPGAVDLYLKRAGLHRLHREWGLALADYTRARELDPGRIEILYFEGSALLEAGKAKEAQATLTKLLAESPQHVDALRTRAEAHQALGHYDEAARDYERAISLATGHRVEDFLGRADALLATGEAGRTLALQTLTLGIQRLGPLVVLQLKAVEIERSARMHDAALARVKALAFRSPSPQWLLLEAEILEEAGRSEEAVRAYDRALAAYSALPPARRRSRAISEQLKRAAARRQALNGR